MAFARGGCDDRCLIKKYSKEEVEGLGQAMREAFLGLVRLSSRKTTHGGEFLKKSLIEGIFEKGPQEVLFVKAIFDAARWDISNRGRRGALCDRVQTADRYKYL
jgi:hypothetical protein